MAQGITYTFEPLGEKARRRRYRIEELERMTTLQLVDVCEREGIVHAAADRLDKDSLVRLVMQFRGSRTPHLILDETEGGSERLERALRSVKRIDAPNSAGIPGKLVAYRGLDTNFFDGFALPYRADLDGVNAIVLDSEDHICAICQVQSYPGQEPLYITRSGTLPCQSTSAKGYILVLLPLELSDTAHRIYMGELESFPPGSQGYTTPLLDFLVLDPVETDAPLTVDFGTSNTAAGIYLDSQAYTALEQGIRGGQLEPDAVNYVRYLTPDGETVPLAPTVIGVDRIEDGKAFYIMGHDAERMVMDGYLGDGFCVFYDIKRWAGSYNLTEELSDQYGNRTLAERKEIIGAYLRYIIDSAQQRFKCKFRSAYLSYPVKQRTRFTSLYREALPEEIEILGDDALDEGVSVLYSTIARIIDGREYRDGVWHKALIIDCGGGTTDLTTCRFKITDGRISYSIEIETAYADGDTDFGGNNLTYRIMQLIKVAIAREISGEGASLLDIAASMDTDIYRMVEDLGRKKVYEALDAAYAAAETVIPTRFKDYEYRSRDEYYMVRNNLYFLFTLAESVKKEFFANPHILQATIGSELSARSANASQVYAPRWKLSARERGSLSLRKDFPEITLTAAFVKTALHGDIYDIIHRFLERLYESGELESYQIINLTGQSCKIDIFRDSLKEYIPGKLMRGQRESPAGDYRLKLSCLDGAIRYVRDKRLGYAKVNLDAKSPSLPYELRAYTHTGAAVSLLKPLSSAQSGGSVSRSIGGAELRLHLLNTRGEEKHVYTVYFDPESFHPAAYSDIVYAHGDSIPQSDTDTIENGELRYFVWLDSGAWGFAVVPIYRERDQLYLGLRQDFPFEVESWVVNYFDGSW